MALIVRASFVGHSKPALVANANFAQDSIEPLNPVRPVCERDLEKWFRREILPLEPMLLRFLRRNWRDRAEIGDLQQETYIRVCEVARRAYPLRAKSFLFLVAHHLMIDRLRRKNVVSIETMTDCEWLAVSTDEPTPEEHVAGRQELRALQNALDALPARCRQVVVLRKIDGYSQREVARLMGITEETVVRQLAKGLHILTLAVPRVRPLRSACRNFTRSKKSEISNTVADAVFQHVPGDAYPASLAQPMTNGV